MALPDFNQGHIPPMENTEMVHITVVVAVIYVEVGHQDAFVAAVVIVYVAIPFRVGTVYHQIT